jgi:lactate dehydrogenase-like 2-hydroxyacid dehydrogenase
VARVPGPHPCDYVGQGRRELHVWPRACRRRGHHHDAVRNPWSWYGKLTEISFHPGYLTAERLAKAKHLKLAITAGIGSDHVDLDAANKVNGGITVAEITGSNVVSVAEHVVMTILVLVRNFVPAHEQIERGDWDVAEVAKNEYDLEGKVVGTV